MKILMISHNGKKSQLQCPDDVAEQILSKDTDPSLKEKLINSLLSNSQPQSCNRQDPLDSSQTELFDSQPPPGNRQPPLESSQHQLGNDQNQLCASQSESSSQSQGNIHTWKSYEEDFLVDLRHEKNDQFIRTKNHSLLWRAISEKVNQELHCNITPTQAMNKYFSLKKKWKEVVDARTGTEAKSFRQKNQFDQLYGTKASTKPQFILDSGKSISGIQGTATVKTTADETTLSGSKQVTGRQIKGKTKRKSTEIIDLMERQNTEFHDRMEQHHQAKLSRMDRFLDLYEKDVNSKMNGN